MKGYCASHLLLLLAVVTLLGNCQAISQPSSRFSGKINTLAQRGIAATSHTGRDSRMDTLGTKGTTTMIRRGGADSGRGSSLPSEVFDHLLDSTETPDDTTEVTDHLSPASLSIENGQFVRGGELAPDAFSAKLLVAFYFLAWYALNVVYNIVNKKVLNVLPAPLTVATIQLGVGALYSTLVWLSGLRPYPKLTPSGTKSVGTVGLYHCLGQLATVMSLGAGPVSFTHIVKALEPFFSAVLSGLYFQKWMNPAVYATLIPVVGGVSYACLKELNFSWLALSAAMVSNIAFALRAIMSKLAMQAGTSAGTDLTPPNMFGLVTWAAFLISIPICLVGESNFWQLLTDALDAATDKTQFIQSLLLSGLFHYLNNEVMYLALGKVHPVTLAVGNTMKRVFILVASVMVFQNPISVQAAVGSAVGIAGVLLYSLTKQYYEQLEASEHAKTLAQLQKPIIQVPSLKEPSTWKLPFLKR